MNCQSLPDRLVMEHKPVIDFTKREHKEEKTMEETVPEKIEENNNRKKKKTEEDLPFCTTAPDAEHARAHNEDEPCDDSRSGSTDES
jgi:hypothetical protein